MRTYHQLTREQRYQIYALKKMGHYLSEIADVLGVNKSSVSRELKRNSGKRGYRPQQAQALALGRRRTGQPRSGPGANLGPLEKGAGAGDQS